MTLTGIFTLVLFSGLLAIQPTLAWDEDLELFDLVEEIPQTFYEFLSLSQVRMVLYVSAVCAYRALSRPSM